jgi:hypothetical protein
MKVIATYYPHFLPGGHGLSKTYFLPFYIKNKDFLYVIFGII